MHQWPTQKRDKAKNMKNAAHGPQRNPDHKADASLEITSGLFLLLVFLRLVG